MNTEELAEVMMPLIDGAYQEMMAINSQHPYTHSEYERARRVFESAIMVFTNGDKPYAEALEMAFGDSGESMWHYTTGWTRQELVEWAGTNPDKVVSSERVRATAANGHGMLYERNGAGDLIQHSAICADDCGACADGEPLPDW
jgi:hypothetical protein